MQLVLSFLFINTDFVTWIVTSYQLMPVVTGVMYEADNVYSIRSTWLCYRLVRFLIHLSNNYYRFCRNLLDMSFSLLLHLLPVLSLETSVCSSLKFCPVFLGSYEYKIVFSISVSIRYKMIYNLARNISGPQVQKSQLQAPFRDFFA